MPHIAIVVHAHGSFDDYYYLHAIADVWHVNGYEVTVVQGPAHGLEADVAILHVDLTVAPQDHVDFVRRFPVSINGDVTDISKRRIVTHLVHQNDGYVGPVIVKANRNWMGRREAELAVKGLLPASDKRILREYRVFDAPEHVPPNVWKDPLLVVERFLPERSGDFYCLRMWKFFGDRETSVLCYSPEPIVKGRNIVHREPLTEVPDALRQCREELGFDFGKFDYAMVDDHPVLYDANRTPTLPRLPKEQVVAEVRLLSEGLRSYLRNH